MWVSEKNGQPSARLITMKLLKEEFALGNYSMPRYFQNMPVVGKPVRANAENVSELRAIEDDIHAHVVDALSAGKKDEDMNARVSSLLCSVLPCWWTPAPGAP